MDTTRAPAVNMAERKRQLVRDELTEMLGTKPGEIKALFKQTLEIDRARELTEQMLAAGLPL